MVAAKTDRHNAAMTSLMPWKHEYLQYRHQVDDTMLLTVAQCQTCTARGIAAKTVVSR